MTAGVCEVSAAEDFLLCPAADPFSLADANINPLTGLSTDYLNHFNEAIMLLEMIPSMPECLSDFAQWRPHSYYEHFAGSRLRQRELAIAAYDLTETLTRQRFDAVCDTMNRRVLAAQGTMRPDLRADCLGMIASGIAASLKPLAARASALIHGQGLADDTGTESLQQSQAAIDAILFP